MKTQKITNKISLISYFLFGIYATTWKIHLHFFLNLKIQIGFFPRNYQKEY